MREFTKETGPRPSKRALKLASKFVREGTGDHLAVAMTLRPKGATQREIRAVLVNPHRNIIKKLVNEKRATIIKSSENKSERIKLVI